MKSRFVIKKERDASGTQPATAEAAEVTKTGLRISIPVPVIEPVEVTQTQTQTMEYTDVVSEPTPNELASAEAAELEAAELEGTEPEDPDFPVVVATKERTKEFCVTDGEAMENFAVSLWKKVRVNLDTLFIKREIRSNRVGCYAEVLFSNLEGKKVVKGKLTDLSDKSGGFLIDVVDVNVHDMLYLEFPKSRHFSLTQVKVIVRRVQPIGYKLKIGVEFIDATLLFKEKLEKFLNKWRTDNKGFDEVESRW